MAFIPPAYARFFSDPIFEANLKALASVQPPLAERMARYKAPYNQPFAVEPARSGDLTLLCAVEDRRLYLHSPEDPQQQAREWVAELAGDPGSAFVVFGFGLGYALQVLRQVLPPRVKVLVVERSIEIFWLALWTVDLREVLGDPRFRYAIDVDAGAITPILHQINISAWEALTAQLYEFNHLLTPFDDYYEQVKAQLSDFFQTQQIIAATENHFALIWACNFLRNLPVMLESAPVKHLFERFSSLPAVVVSAGPSLEKNMNRLADFAERGVVIATSPTLRSLLKAGIRPHLVISIDGGEPNYMHFHDLPDDDVPLVFDTTFLPNITVIYRGGGRRFALFAPDKEELFSLVGDHVDVRGSLLNVGASVANLGLHLAYRMGCDPIVFVGQDLAYTGDATHFSGSVFAGSADSVKDGSARIEAVDIYGQKTYTQEIWLAFREWFRLFIAGHPDRRYINATEGGIGIPGAENIALADVLASLPIAGGGEGSRRERIASLVNEAFTAGEGDFSQAATAIAGELKRLSRHLKTISRQCRKGVELVRRYQMNVDRARDVSATMLPYYEQLAKIQRGLEADGKAMAFLRLPFRPVVSQIEQSLVLAGVVDERQAVRNDLARAEAFFVEIGRRAAVIEQVVGEVLGRVTQGRE
ncbi:DUF115 domain-containing protein [Heliobacterium gestii]|uniref:DUF115 domain-containing protein n=1 Tax=Heliomicrobium gestii TaxID=2699 RepID=A0A845LBP3_HELGE|nr:6-hydroxymethylpterin diphosphokinase MptE-like protein [Heliomicrobium gestii]MBM7866729.1 hypothetical protein [Heliomicrobium gestii]MZP42991.1 DUF115 domain-containing protein [Heliomicrobium gestii]